MRRPGRLDRSQWLILAMVGTAVLMAGFGVVYRYAYGRRALDFWGSEHAARIRNAEAVELLVLKPEASPAGETTQQPPMITDLTQRAWQIERVIPIGQVSDLRHVRRLFVQDSYLDWEATTHPAATWKYALRFHDPHGTSTLLLDGDGPEVCLLENERQASMLANVMPSLRKFFDRQANAAPPVSPP